MSVGSLSFRRLAPWCILSARFSTLTVKGGEKMISGIFGLPGAGKSVFLCKCARTAQRHRPLLVGGNILHYGDYDYILSNFPCTGCHQLDPETLGKVAYRKTLFLIDEISMIADSRAFKSFSMDYQLFFTQHRKFECDIIWCSQSYDDTDKKIRNLTGKFFWLRKAPILSDYLSIVAPIDSFIRVTDGKIMSGYELSPPLLHGIVWLPRYWSMFDTHQVIAKQKLDSDYDLIPW